MGDVSIDDSDILALAADIAGAGRDVIPFAYKSVQVTANNIKKSWVAKVGGSAGLEGLARTVDYDVRAHVADVEAEIGYDKDRGGQAPLGNVSEYGTSRHPPRGYGAAALQENAPDFERGMTIAVSDALAKRNL